MSNQIKVLEYLSDNQMTGHALSLSSGLTARQINSCISILLDKGLIKVVGSGIGDANKTSNLYAKSTEEEQRVLKRNREWDLTTPQLTKKESSMKPFSNDEMHYGKAGKKWTWEDVQQEAKRVQYNEGNTFKNRLPINYYT
jgi:hypothetical protein